MTDKHGESLLVNYLFRNFFDKLVCAFIFVIELAGKHGIEELLRTCFIVICRVRENILRQCLAETSAQHLFQAFHDNGRFLLGDNGVYPV